MADRYDYQKGALKEALVAPSPIEQLRLWLEEAQAARAIEPSAMCVSTVGPDARPSARFVLLRGLDERGLTFFTNYESRKGRELSENPYACATFWWGTMERQVRIEGRIERTSEEESDAYFHSRPHDSQIASAASPQSSVVSSRDEVEVHVATLAAKYAVAEVPRPAHWGGFRLIPDRFEFWQGRPARLHDRLVYRLEETRWRIERLAP